MENKTNFKSVTNLIINHVKTKNVENHYAGHAMMVKLMFVARAA